MNVTYVPRVLPPPLEPMAVPPNTRSPAKMQMVDEYNKECVEAFNAARTALQTECEKAAAMRAEFDQTEFGALLKTRREVSAQSWQRYRELKEDAAKYQVGWGDWCGSYRGTHGGTHESTREALAKYHAGLLAQYEAHIVCDADNQRLAEAWDSGSKNERHAAHCVDIVEVHAAALNVDLERDADRFGRKRREVSEEMERGRKRQHKGN